MRSGRIFWGLVLIIVGFFFLANRSGLLRLDPGLLWPILVILLGVFVLLGRTRFLADPQEEHQVSIPLDGAKQASIKIEHGAGRLVISGKAATGELLSGSFHHVEHSASRSGDTLNLKLRSTLGEDFFWMAPWNWGTCSHEWDFALNPDIPISLDLDTGASEAHLDLRNLNVTSIDLDTGASSTTVVLPAKAGFTRFDADFGAASLDITVPEGVAADIRIDSGLGSIKVNEARFPRSGKHYTSPDYASAANKVEMDIDTGVSSVVIR
jgi:hypothetical protein